MSVKVLPKVALPDWVDWLCASYRVVGPKPLHGEFIFGEVTSAQELTLDYPSTVLPPKKYLLPQREELFHFNDSHANAASAIPERQTVVLGLHTCDIHAIQLLDRVQETGYADQHYQAHRANTLLVSIECLTPCSEHSFCKDMGTLSITEGFDLHLTDLGDRYIVDVGSERGTALIDGFVGFLDPTLDDQQEVARVLAQKWQDFPYRFEFDATELPSLLQASFNSEYWDELGNRCLACAMCTNVCPTCYCFNVVDEVDMTLNAGKRFRQWDSCQLDQFASVAGGHDFRKSRAARQRHRFFRKGKYQWEAFGLAGCVGCGRCARACLVHITPVETFNELYRRRRKAEASEGAK